MKLAVIDGLGGGIGSQVIESIRKESIQLDELIALGTNSGATSKMLNKGADRGATGENAIRVTSKRVDILIGPLGIIIPNSMHGEITTAIAEAVADSPAKKYLIGIRQPHVELVGIKDKSIKDLIEELTKKVKDFAG